MWTPDPIFRNQRLLESVKSAIQETADSTLVVSTIDCKAETEPEQLPFCLRFGLNNATQGRKFIFSKTIKVEVDCPDMDFESFPLDTQECGFYMKDKERISKVKWNDPVVKTSKLTSAEYDISVEETSSNNEKDTEGMVGFTLTMKRKPDIYLYTYFVPCGLLVVVSWVSFAVSAEAVPGRLGLLLTLLLMLINLTNR